MNNKTSQIRAERASLIISAAGCLLIAFVALLASHYSGSQAILLDGLFNLTYFLAGLFTIKVSLLVLKGDDARFPYGYSFFEPLVNGIKGLLILGVSIMALIGAIEALLAGGRHIEAGIATAYGAFASVTGWLMAWATHRGYKTSASPLVKADADGWIVNAAISTAVLLAFAGIWMIKGTPYEYVAPYLDPALVLLVVLISLSVPIRMAWTALMGLLNRAASAETTDQISAIVDASLETLPVQERFVRVIQPGRMLMISVHVVLPPDYKPESLKMLDRQRQKTLEQLQDRHKNVILDMFFTTDRQWGAPMSETYNMTG
jgi:cation diffusion facilitator family transporter